MSVGEIEFDPDDGDTRRYGYSLAHLTELILPCLDAVGARSVAEVGAYAGDLTRVLAQWAARRNARVLAIDPAPQNPLIALAESCEQLELIRQPSLDALAALPLPDVVIIDGDHNYYTVSQELKVIGERCTGPALPLLLFHDVCWPHARRDDYFDVRLIPEGDRHELAGDRGGLVPGEAGLDAAGLPYPNSAAREGGPRNGVLTAVEDFVATRDGLRLVVVPAFFGLGAVWDPGAPWAHAVAQILDPWNRHPIVGRLEAARVHHLVRGHSRDIELWDARERLARQEALLRRLLSSSAFELAARLSQVRVRAGVAPAQSALSKADIRRALNE